MFRVVVFFTLLLVLYTSFANVTEKEQIDLSISKEYKKKVLGSPIYIEIFKKEHILDLYAKIDSMYQLLSSYRICKYSGGLGPKKYQGDLKSPEGFYTIKHGQLKFNSRFHKAIDIGFPNNYDRFHGYNGKYLMIHGACISTGCYAMTNRNIDEIFQFVNSALNFGQPYVQVSIYPFRMHDINMKKYKYSYYIDFWKQLKSNYDYFQKTHQVPLVSVINGRYTINKTF